jgi:hypothetical protein
MVEKYGTGSKIVPGSQGGPHLNFATMNEPV